MKITAEELATVIVGARNEFSGKTVGPIYLTIAEAILAKYTVTPKTEFSETVQQAARRGFYGETAAG